MQDHLICSLIAHRELYQAAVFHLVPRCGRRREEGSEELCSHTIYSLVKTGSSVLRTIWKMAFGLVKCLKQTVRFPILTIKTVHSLKNKQTRNTLTTLKHCLMFASFHPNSSCTAASSSAVVCFFSLLEPYPPYASGSIVLLSYYQPIFSPPVRLSSQISSYHSLIICCLHLKSLQFADFCNVARNEHNISQVILAQLQGEQLLPCCCLFLLPCCTISSYLIFFLTHTNLFQHYCFPSALVPLIICVLDCFIRLYQFVVLHLNISCHAVLPLISLILWLYSPWCTTGNFNESLILHLFKLLE